MKLKRYKKRGIAYIQFFALLLINIIYDIYNKKKKLKKLNYI